MDREFQRDWGGVGGPSRKIMEIPGGGGSTVKPPGTENPGGWGVNLEKTLRLGVWTFSGSTYLQFHT